MKGNSLVEKKGGKIKVNIKEVKNWRRVADKGGRFGKREVVAAGGDKEGH